METKDLFAKVSEKEHVEESVFNRICQSIARKMAVCDLVSQNDFFYEIAVELNDKKFFSGAQVVFELSGLKGVERIRNEYNFASKIKNQGDFSMAKQKYLMCLDEITFLKKRDMDINSVVRPEKFQAYSKFKYRSYSMYERMRYDSNVKIITKIEMGIHYHLGTIAE